MAERVKAFMSDADVRSERTWQATPAAQAAYAVLEAEVVLTWSEPFVASADWFNVGRKSDTEHSQCGRLAMCSPMYQALAESLAAFVGSEVL